MKQVSIKQIKNGEFLKLKESETASVYVRGEYDKASKTYCIYKYNNINHEIFVKGDRKCWIDFEF